VTAGDDVAREVWLLMSDLVLDHGRRREVAEATGMSFGRTRAIRRVAREPMTMSELAVALDIDRPNATVLVDELEAEGCVRRRAHPTDRRAKLVEATRRGRTVARRADEILSAPPPAIASLSRDELAALRRALRAAQTFSGATSRGGDRVGRGTPSDRRTNART
jgi:DNA-binding MarR family transcriptional regulator